MTVLATPSPRQPVRDWLSASGREIARAWSQPAVRRGLFGTLAIELGSFTPAYLPRSSPLWGPLQAAHLDGAAVKVIGTAIVLLGIALLVDGWFRLRRTDHRPRQPWAILTLWSLPLLFGPPIFSHDAYSYAAQGWMVHNHLNPYDGGPGLLPGPFADLVAWVWRYTPAPYGPLSLQISHGLVDLSGFHPTVAAVLMRIPAVIGVALIVGCLPRIARYVGVDPTRVVWFACLNPLLVIDYVGGAHNDALMMGLVVLALWSACHRHWWPLAAVVIGVASAIKQPAYLAALALPFLAGPMPPWRRPPATLKAIGQVLFSLLLAAAAFAGLTWACGLGYGWIHALGVPGSVTTVSPTTVIGEGLQRLLDADNRNYITIVQNIGTLCAFALIGLIAIVIGRRQPLQGLALGWLAVAFLGPALHSWYVLWGGLLLPLTSGRRHLPRVAVGITVVLLSYAACNLAWRNGAVALGVAAAALLLWYAVEHERGINRGAAPPSPPDPATRTTPDRANGKTGQTVSNQTP
jgi:hypothetical protein